MLRGSGRAVGEGVEGPFLPAREVPVPYCIVPSFAVGSLQVQVQVQKEALDLDLDPCPASRPLAPIRQQPDQHTIVRRGRITPPFLLSLVLSCPGSVPRPRVLSSIGPDDKILLLTAYAGK